MRNDVETEALAKDSFKYAKNATYVPTILIFHRSGIIVAAERMCGYKSAIKKDLTIRKSSDK